MTERDARRVADLLSDWDQIVEWYDETIARDKEAKKFRFIEFGEVVQRNGRDGRGRGWQGELMLSRKTVANMFAGAKAAIIGELRLLGVDPPGSANTHSERDP